MDEASDELLVMVGVGVDMLNPQSKQLEEFLTRVFYTTPGIATGPSELVHCHGITFRVPPKWDDIEEWWEKLWRRDPKRASAKLVAAAAEVGNLMAMVHVENTTKLHHGYIGVAMIPVDGS